jgi:predicted alpha-1,6-mannanase (GH76 family)
VIANADALWTGRATIDGLPVFSADAKTPADPAPDAPERDLSVQLGAWLTLEAAVSLG